MTLADKIHTAQVSGDPQQLTDLLPYANTLGIQVVLENDLLVAHMPFHQNLIGDLGAVALHNGTIAALLEITAAITILWQFNELNLPIPINVATQYENVARPRTTYATAEVIKLSKQVANARCTAWQNERESPTATAFCLFTLKGRS